MLIYRRRVKNVLNIFEVRTSFAIYIKVKMSGKGSRPEARTSYTFDRNPKRNMQSKKDQQKPLKNRVIIWLRAFSLVLTLCKKMNGTGEKCYPILIELCSIIFPYSNNSVITRLTGRLYGLWARNWNEFVDELLLILPSLHCFYLFYSHRKSRQI